MTHDLNVDEELAKLESVRERIRLLRNRLKDIRAVVESEYGDASGPSPATEPQQPPPVKKPETRPGRRTL